MVTNVPNLRFPGFMDEWEEISFGDVIKMSSGGTPSMQEPSYWEGDIPFMTAAAMHDTFISTSHQFITGSGLASGSRILKKGNLLLLVRGSMLWKKIPICYNNIDVAFNQDIKGLIPSDRTDSMFILSWLQSKETVIKHMVTATGIGAGKLDSNDVLTLPLSLPSKKEQLKISRLFTSIDQRIETQNKIIRELETSIHSLRERLLSQQIRFKTLAKNHLSEWENKKLEDVTIKKSSNISANTIEKNVGSYIIYGAAGVLKKVDFYEEEDNYVSIVKDGAGAGRLFYCEGKSSVLGTMEIIKANGVNTIFLFHLLSRIDFTKYVTGSTIPHIYYKDYKNEEISLPGLHEQNKIANFLNTMTKKVQVERALLKKYEDQKNYFLTNLFI